MAKAFDKDSWLAQKEQRLQDAKVALEEGLKALQSSDDWRRILEGMAQVGALSVGRYSFQNQLIIWQQRPGTRLAATFQTWKQSGRFVRKGEQGISILAPVVKNVAEDDADSNTKELRLVGFRLVRCVCGRAGQDVPHRPHGVRQGLLDRLGQAHPGTDVGGLTGHEEAAPGPAA